MWDVVLFLCVSLLTSAQREATGKPHFARPPFSPIPFGGKHHGAQVFENLMSARVKVEESGGRKSMCQPGEDKNRDLRGLLYISCLDVAQRSGFLEWLRRKYQPTWGSTNFREASMVWVGQAGIPSPI